MLTKEQLIGLRKQIIAGSLFLHHYENDLGIPAKVVCDFFDGYSEYLTELMLEDGHKDYEYYDIISEYDTDENLWNWYCCFDEDPLPRPQLLTREQLNSLRELALDGSLYTGDYEDEFGIHPNTLENFFDGYSEYLMQLMLEDGYWEDEYDNLLSTYDTEENLWQYYCSMDCPLTIHKESNN